MRSQARSPARDLAAFASLKVTLVARPLRRSSPLSTARTSTLPSMSSCSPPFATSTFASEVFDLSLSAAITTHPPPTSRQRAQMTPNATARLRIAPAPRGPADGDGGRDHGDYERDEEDQCRRLDAHGRPE